MNTAIWNEILIGLWETLYMSVASTFGAYVLGMPLGILLAVTDKRGLKPNRIINIALGVVTNILRSIPFLILFVAVIPFTRIIVGTSIGAVATIVPLTIAASPLVARLCETSIKEVDKGITEAALSCGAPLTKVVFKAILPECLPSLLSNAAVAFVTVLGYSAMAGFCGGGGLGAIAVNYGYYRNNQTVMVVTNVIIVVIVQLFQEFGLWLARRKDKRVKI